jgi:N-methylhydantoinase A
LNIPYTRSLLANFHQEHQRRYGYRYDQRELELVTLRLRATVKSKNLNLASTQMQAEDPPARKSQTAEKARVYLAGKNWSAPVYPRADLAAGKNYSGPAIITEYSATTVVPPGMRFWTDRATNLVIQTRFKVAK